ncbi:MAG TPA: DNA recombination protein RmuC [Spirochaetota bacterium]|nr:DNA recombination protein RmuC [Spirochaetota bacterium]
MSEAMIIIPVAAVLVLLVIAMLMKLRTLDEMRREMANLITSSRQETQSKLDLIQGQMLSNAQTGNATLQAQLRESAQLIRDVSNRLAAIDKTNSQILDFSKQMQSLENILKNPKQRGVLGEYFLETLLGNVLQPNQYRMQYPFSNNEKVDAVVIYRDRVIPIDAKFSLENYNRLMVATDVSAREALEKEFRADVKKRIDETSKYIRPKEGTTDFAFMFVPAEGVYYNLLVYNVGANIRTQDLIEYAFSKHVIIVSPTSFYAYLETVLMGIRAQRVEDGVKDIMKKVQDLDLHLKTFGQYMEKIGSGLSVTVSHYNSAIREYGKIDKDVTRLTDKAGGGFPELEAAEKPHTDE